MTPDVIATHSSSESCATAPSSFISATSRGRISGRADARTVEQNAVQPARGPVLELHAVFARPGPSDAVLDQIDPEARTRIPRLPLRPPDNYLRRAMAATLLRQAVDLDFLIQVQTDAHRMPIENAAVRWPLGLSPYVKAATIHIPAQRSTRRHSLHFQTSCAIRPGTAFPNTSLSEIRTAYAGECTPNWQTYGRP